jgi:hypothetical protein
MYSAISPEGGKIDQTLCTRHADFVCESTRSG